MSETFGLGLILEKKKKVIKFNISVYFESDKFCMRSNGIFDMLAMRIRVAMHGILSDRFWVRWHEIHIYLYKVKKSKHVTYVN